MSAHEQLVGNRKQSVSTLLGASEPEPAASVRLGSDLGEKSVEEGSFDPGHVSRLPSERARVEVQGYRYQEAERIMTLKAKLFAAASASTALQALLGTPPALFQWHDTQLPQTATFPAVVVNQISAPRDYVLGGRMSTYEARLQLTVYGTGNDSENASAVVAAITGFFQTFNAIGVSGLATYPNRVVNDRDGGIAATQPLSYQRDLDVMVWNDEKVS